MSRNEEFGAGRGATSPGWVRVRADTVYANEGGAPPLVAVPRAHITKSSQEHEGDHVFGYVTAHQNSAGRTHRAFNLHTANGTATVEMRKRAWVFLHHGQGTEE